MPPSKRKHEDHDGEIVALAAAVRRSSQKDELSDAILAAMESGAPLPSTKLAKGPKFAEVPDEACFGEDVGVEFIDKTRTERLSSSARGKKVLKSIGKCQEVDEDEAHWGGANGELLDAIVSDACPPRIHVMRAVNPFNPVALLTPAGEAALCAVAAVTIQESEPIAVYMGDMCLPEAAGEAQSSLDKGNMYLYELDGDEMRARGYDGPNGVRIDASKAGGEARFINDQWAPGGLPARTANCYIELVFDGDAHEFLLVFFASKRIKKGEEIIANYGPDYWKVAAGVLLAAHEHAPTSASAAAPKRQKKRK